MREKMPSSLIVARPVALPTIIKQARRAMCLATLVNKGATTLAETSRPALARSVRSLGFVLGLDIEELGMDGDLRYPMVST
jgi:hypothetical protein